VAVLRAPPCPETELLLSCARTGIDTPAAERIKAVIETGIDWDHLVLMARRHGIVSPLYRRLHALGPTVTPPASLARLQEDFATNALRNLYLMRELVLLLDRLKERGIRAIPFKGPVLALWAYGDLSLRKPGDLDILIDPRDALPAKDLMVSLGYEVVTPLGEDKLPYARGKHEYRFVSADKGLSVELRWRLASQPLRVPLDFASLWSRCRPVVLSGTTVWSLPPEELLLILCWHGTQHGWDRLMWVCDLPEVVRAYPELDWKRVQEQATALGCRRMVALGLILAGDLLGMTLPSGILPMVQAERVAVGLAAQIRSRLFQDADSLFSEDSETATNGRNQAERERRRYYHRVMERLPDRIRYRLAPAQRWIKPNARDRALLPLPDSLAFLYYLLRLMRVAGEYGPALLRRLRL
jgi:hypothetical protein